MLFPILSLISNLAIFFMTFISLLVFFVKGGDANMKVKAERCFRYFTVDSNVLAALASAVMVYFNIRTLASGDLSVPAWATVFKFTGAAAVALTFFVVIFMLAPFSKDGFFSLYEGTGFIMHLVTPVLAMLSFILFDGGERLSYLTILIAVIPTMIYAVVYFYMVMIKGEGNGGWEDFYGFNKGGKWYLFAPGVVGMSALFSFLLLLLHNIAAK